MSSLDTSEFNREGQSAGTPSRQIIAFLNTMGGGVLSPVLPFIVRQYISNESILALPSIRANPPKPGTPQT